MIVRNGNSLRMTGLGEEGTFPAANNALKSPTIIISVIPTDQPARAATFQCQSRASISIPSNATMSPASDRSLAPER